MNESTVIGIFDDYKTAQAVARELTDSGIPREAVEVRSNFATGAAGSSERYGADNSEHEGGISGFFHRLFGSNDSEEGGHLAEAVHRGSSVVAVTASADVIERAIGVMNEHDPVDIDRRVSDYQERGYERHDPNSPPYTGEEAAREHERFKGTSPTEVIPVMEEELQVGKRAVRRGGVRVYSHIVEQPVEEDVTLREEHVRVERRPADKLVNSKDAAAFRDQSIEVTEMVEEPVISKRARVREEVVVGKEVTEKTEQVRDTVRRTDVKVEKLPGNGNSETGDYSQEFRDDYDSRYANSGATYDAMEPAYAYGYQMANDDRYRGRSWSDVEADLKTDYLRNNRGSSWDQVKGAVRYGWERVTGKR